MLLKVRMINFFNNKRIFVSRIVWSLKILLVGDLMISRMIDGVNWWSEDAWHSVPQKGSIVGNLLILD